MKRKLLWQLCKQLWVSNTWSFERILFDMETLRIQNQSLIMYTASLLWNCCRKLIDCKLHNIKQYSKCGYLLLCMSPFTVVKTSYFFSHSIAHKWLSSNNSSWTIIWWPERNLVEVPIFRYLIWNIFRKVCMRQANAGFPCPIWNNEVLFIVKSSDQVWRENSNEPRILCYSPMCDPLNVMCVDREQMNSRVPGQFISKRTWIFFFFFFLQVFRW